MSYLLIYKDHLICKLLACHFIMCFIRTCAIFTHIIRKTNRQTNNTVQFVIWCKCMLSIVTHYVILTLILPTLKVISLCHQYRARPECTSMQSDQALYCWLTNFKVFILISLKLTMDSAKMQGWFFFSFKKFGMIRVKTTANYNRLIWFKQCFLNFLKWNNPS